MMENSFVVIIIIIIMIIIVIIILKGNGIFYFWYLMFQFFTNISNGVLFAIQCMQTQTVSELKDFVKKLNSLPEMTVI